LLFGVIFSLRLSFASVRFFVLVVVGTASLICGEDTVLIVACVDLHHLTNRWSQLLAVPMRSFDMISSLALQFTLALASSGSASSR